MKAPNPGGEPIDPLVRRILDDVVVREGGIAYVDRYVDWIIELRRIPVQENSRVFLQLAVLAKQYFNSGRRPVGESLAALARIGLNRLVKPAIKSTEL